MTQRIRVCLFPRSYIYKISNISNYFFLFFFLEVIFPRILSWWSVGQNHWLERLAGILHGIQIVAESFHEGCLLQKEAVGAATKNLSHIKAAATTTGTELGCRWDATSLVFSSYTIKEEAASSWGSTVVNKLLGIGRELRLRSWTAPNEVQRMHREGKAFVLQQAIGG